MSQISLALAKLKTIVADGTITGATAATPIVVTSTAHGLETGDIVQVSGVTGNTAANGQWTVTKVDANSYSLDNSVGNSAYVSGGTAKHLGFATAAGTVDNTVFSAKPDFTLKARLEFLDAGANARVVFEDAGDTAFVTRQPLAVFQAAGKIGGSNGGVYSGQAGDLDKQFSVKSYEVPDARMAASGNVVRTKVYISGGAGKKAQFSSWMEY